MLIEFIATIAMGFAAGGIALLLKRLARGRLPGWIVPVAAGAGMIGYQIWSEYSWYGRTVAALPPAFEVVTVNRATTAWRPWSYVVPQANRFVAVDVAGAKRNEKLPGQIMTTLFLFERNLPVIAVPQLVDCAANRRADLTEGAEFGADGSVINADWVALPPDDPLLRTLCAAPANG